MFITEGPPKDRLVTLKKDSMGVGIYVDGQCWAWLDNDTNALHINNPDGHNYTPTYKGTGEKLC